MCASKFLGWLIKLIITVSHVAQLSLLGLVRKENRKNKLPTLISFASIPPLNEKIGPNSIIKMCATGNHSLEYHSFWLYITGLRRGCQHSSNEISGGQWLFIPIWLIKDASQERWGALPALSLTDGGAVTAPAGISLPNFNWEMSDFPFISPYPPSFWQSWTYFKGNKYNNTNIAAVNSQAA